MLLLVYRKNWHFLCYRSFVLVVLHFLLYTLYFFLINLQDIVVFVLQDISWASVGNHSLVFQREKLRCHKAEVIQDHKFSHRWIYAECFLVKYPGSLLTSSIIYGVFRREAGGSMASENQNLCGVLLWGLLKTVNTTNK